MLCQCSPNHCIVSVISCVIVCFRLSGDVQDLKSSFKLVISQGLRSITQGVGCIVSLYIISPQMTGVVALVLPAIIVTGTLFGSVLRRWSRNAQEQVAIATGVADEALGNMRTVRAFAMEDAEHRWVWLCVGVVGDLYL